MPAPEIPSPLGARDLHLWLCASAAISSTDHFKRSVLSHYAPLAPTAWRFTRGEHGKPVLVDPPRPLAFNLSDSVDWLVCAVTAGTPVGVDIEYCDPERDVMKLARRFFRSAEIAALEALTREQQLARFYDYWTLKEARVKAHGVALGLELERSGFQLDLAPGEQAGGGLMRIAQDPLHDAMAHACLLEPIAHYRLATCWLRPDDFPPRVQLYELQASGGMNSHDLSRALRATSGPINPHSTGFRESC